LNRSFLFLLAFALFFSSVHASIALVSPVSQKLNAGTALDIGSAMPGESVELVFSNDDGKGGLWNQLEVVRESIPSNWKVFEPELFVESLVLKITIPPAETEKLQSIGVRLSDARNPADAEEVSLRLLVKNNLLSASFSPLQESVLLGQKASYRVVLVNNSIASNTVTIRSSLPSFWFEPVMLSLDPKPNASAMQELTLDVYPRTYGIKNFSFRVDSELSQKTIVSYPTDLLVKPTLEGKFQSGLFGFPFFSPNLSPFYFFNALLGSLQ
jgi:hypothetical protein